jgi:hypothetical protein
MAHRWNVEEEEEENTPAVMQWLRYMGAGCGALLISCPPLAWYEARAIAFVACLTFGGGFWWLLGIGIGGVLRESRSQQKLKDKATC